MEKILEKIILEMPANLKDLDSFKRKMAKKYGISCPKNIDLLQTYHKLKLKKNLDNILRLRPVRSLSGIVNVSVLLKPFPCPGKCIFCPTQKGIPQSYLQEEPAVQRAILNDFHPQKQVLTRLKSLKMTGHPTDKIELRIIGGTWSYYPKNYQTWFIKQCFLACNNSSLKSLKDLQKENEKKKNKIIGITIETRPDFITKKEIIRMRELGITRVELGVQTIYNDVLEKNKRGHKIEATIKATELLKDAGFKVSFQLMPNLFSSTFKKDIDMFETIFSNPDFKPDLIKIYPVALVKNTLLYKIYKQGEYKPYSKEQLIKLLIEIKKHIPYWCRIERIIRDIPAKYIVEGGTKVSNLRELVKTDCKCIRCREIREKKQEEKIYLFKETYQASEGKEIFLSFENKKRTRLYALLRLRIPKETFIPVLKDSSIIREIHTYGQMAEVGKKNSKTQHKGLGKKLVQEAETITKNLDIKKIAVISGVGVRGYYRKLGYRLKDTYMIKSL